MDVRVEMPTRRAALETDQDVNTDSQANTGTGDSPAMYYTEYREHNKAREKAEKREIL